MKSERLLINIRGLLAVTMLFSVLAVAPFLAATAESGLTLVWNGDADKQVAVNVGGHANTTRGNASGAKITSNGNSSDFPGIYFLFDAKQKETQVKISFTTNGGQIEHLWAEVLRFSEGSVIVRYLTPPVSHTGKLERVHEHPLADIEDWMVIDKHDRIHGGYTQRVMFEQARKQWGGLPPELEKQASRYVA